VAVALPAAAFAFAAYGLLQGIGTKTAPASRAFASTSQFWTWCLVVCTQSALWAWALVVALPILWRHLRHESQGARLKIAFLAFVLTALGVASATSLGLRPGAKALGLRHIPFGGLSLRQVPFASYQFKADVLVGGGLLVAFVTCLAGASVALTLNRFHIRGRPSQQDLRCFMTLRGDLTTLLGVLGALLAVSTLATGALRSAMLAVDTNPAYIRLRHTYEYRKAHMLSVAHTPRAPVLEFAQQYVLAYGLVCAVLLTIIFLPSFLALRAAGACVRDGVCELPGPAEPCFHDVVLQRKRLDKVLQTSLSGNPTVKAGAAVLAPLAASAVSLLLT
jgi:hypothetical protein